jgi:hypothetical protein
MGECARDVGTASDGRAGATKSNASVKIGGATDTVAGAWCVTTQTAQEVGDAASA